MTGMVGVGVEKGRAVLRDDWPRPSEPSEVRVRVRRAGVCSTDLALVRGYMGYEGILGHEFVGEIAEGDDAGTRVVGELNAACGQCHFCRRDLGRHCPHRTVLGILGRPGCFAEELSLPRENLHPIPDSISDDAAVFTEPLAAAYELIEQLETLPLERFDRAPGGNRAPRWLVAGDGRLGLLTAMVLASEGHEVVVAGRHPERLARFGLDLEFRQGLLEGDPPEAHLVGAFDAVVEATGNAAVLPRLLPFVRPRGLVCIKTTTETPIELDLAPIVVHELTLLGSRCGRFEPAIAALAADRFPVTRAIDERYSLERGLDALTAAAKPGILKVLIDVT